MPEKKIEESSMNIEKDVADVGTMDEAEEATVVPN